MGIHQQSIGQRPNNNVTNGPAPVEGLAPLARTWQPYGDRIGGLKPEGPKDLQALGEALGYSVGEYVDLRYVN